MGTKRYGDFRARDNASVFAGDYQPTTNIYYGEEPQNIEKILLDSLTFERWDARLRNIAPALDKTCEWIFLNPLFKAWLNHDEELPLDCLEEDDSKQLLARPSPLDSDQSRRPSRFLWLKGKPGSGKSTIMKRVMEWAQRERSNYKVLSYFFNARSAHGLEKSSLGLYRSMTSQLLSVHPKSVETFVQIFSGKVHNGGMSEEWTVAELQNFWLQLLTKHKLPPFFVFIDALDEGHEDDIRSMVELIVEIDNMACQNKTDMLTLLSSRYYPNITIQNSFSVSIENQSGHKDDIRLYISQKLRGDTGQEFETLGKQVFARSQDVFLWVFLVVSMLNKWYDHGYSTRARLKMLEKVPLELHDVFDRILYDDANDSVESDESNDIQQSIALFRWVLFSLRPLQPMELRIAVHTSTLALEEPDISLEGGEEDVAAGSETAKKRLIHLSRGLIEFAASVREPVVQFIHETVRDFLLGKSRGTRTNQNLSGRDRFTTEFNAGVCHCAIAKICLWRLMVVARGLTRSKHWNDKSALVAYAAVYWWRHIEAAGDDADEEVLRLATELCLTRSYLYTWLQNFRIDEPRTTMYHSPKSRPTDAPSALYCAASIGYEKLVNVMLNQKIDVNAVGGKYGSALSVASFQGHEAIVRMLLDNGAKINAAQGIMYGSLYAASQEGHESIVKLLLQRGVDAYRLRDCDQEQRKECGSALVTASSRGYLKIVRILLENNVNANADRSDGKSALQTASWHGHEAIVKVLLENKADVNAYGGVHDSALEMASDRGHDAVVQVLLAHDADVNAHRTGQPGALYIASARGFESIARMLLEKGADVHATDNNRFNVLRAASTKGIQDLLKTYGAMAFATEYNQMLYSASENGRESTVEALLKKGADPNAFRGKLGSTLQAAVHHGHYKIAQILHDHGAR